MIERLLLVRNVAAVRGGQMQAARGDTARFVFAGTAALAAVHTVTDAFVAPEPGTRWDDHVLAASVSLTLLVGAIVAWPRVRDGARAAMALVLGILALVGERSPLPTRSPVARAAKTGQGSCSRRRESRRAPSARGCSGAHGRWRGAGTCAARC